ncbi:DUF6389 family protein [Pantoea coffeiphila]|uniref:DUF6389 family protein n=1 Tax=Pantoea coffeiphila TaxID=1465635 RepID=UPI00195FB50A|nr:DUF6389 family protein [Pantoea coffeiphila]MBM7344438.1 hypothetical protein [Pantoea coffeiphila]
MTKGEYASVLQNILKLHTQEAIDKIININRILPEKACITEVGIHPTQDEEGMFSIIVHLCGPDLYLLNQVIAPYRVLFDVKYSEGKLQPDVPLFCPEETSFSVNDLIVEVSINWVQEIWALSGGLGIPAYTFGEECSKPEGLIPLKSM